jgi:tripartite-type tricarboxylate transporter receptor subunit TctC
MKLHLSALLTAIIVTTTTAVAQTYPDKPITWIVGFPAGGVADIGARVLARAFSAKIGQPVIVENKPGATGVIAAEAIAAAKPDGYTIASASNGVMAANKFLYKKLSYDPLTSFTLLGGTATTPLLLIVPANSSFKTVNELVAYAKKNPGKLNYASAGIGGVGHLLTEYFALKADIELTHIPYKGAIQALPDLAGGQLDLTFDYATNIKPYLDGGKIRILAQTGTTRTKSYPDVPLLAEVGYPDVNLASWSVIVGPPSLPQPIAEKISRAFIDVFKDPAVVSYYESQGANILDDMDQQKLHSFIISEQAKHKDMIERAGVTPQ